MSQSSRSIGDAFERLALMSLEFFAAEFGLGEFAGSKVKVQGTHGDTWEVDLVFYLPDRAPNKNIQEDGNGKGSILVECKCLRRRLEQDKVASLAYRIRSTGAGGGILVTQLPLQSGAKMLATAEKIEVLQIFKGSCPEALLIARLSDEIRNIFAGFRENIGFSDSFSAVLIRPDGTASTTTS